MYKILITYSSLIIACIVVILAFITATTYTQLAVAIILYPVLVFFVYKVFPSKYLSYTSKKTITKNHVPEKSKTFEAANKESIGISDIDKRVFLKLIGGTGIFLFLFSLFNKKTEDLFFKYLPGSFPDKNIAGSNTNNLPQDQLLDEYKISEIDDNVISFHGFIKKDGSWYILRIDTTVGSFRYSRGDFNFPDSWNNRENLKYDYYHNLF